MYRSIQPFIMYSHVKHWVQLCTSECTVECTAECTVECTVECTAECSVVYSSDQTGTKQGLKRETFSSETDRQNTSVELRLRS